MGNKASRRTGLGGGEDRRKTIQGNLKTCPGLTIVKQKDGPIFVSDERKKKLKIKSS